MIKNPSQEVMALYWICVVAFLGAVVSGDDSCPDPKDLAPCTCDGEGLNCMGARTLEEIKKAFQAKFKYGGVRSVWVQGTPLTHLPADIFGNVRSQQFYVEVNDITTIDANAFSASKKSLHTLSLFGNKIKDFPYSGLSVYENLGVLNLGRNLIETIPDDAFNNRNLYAIILAQNKITHIGKNAFSNLPSLGRLEMALNNIVTLGPMSLAFKAHSASLQINLSANKISEVASSAFTGADPYAIFFSQNQLTSLKKDPFANLITRIAQKGGFLEVSANPFSCQGCDYSWLVTNKEILASRLIGFSCTDRRSLTELTKSNIGCPS
ncbi:uncharacterized protein NPIL_148061 [Nephila pilipes]|uniref:Uncharacterized protein n=1 Tax=Nephila pilipes TaxID=299642 RepID=A0A8X6MF01_NEPPI|nr:uncharacterized protein NPIL_148061 [Nephila pilipes]